MGHRENCECPECAHEDICPVCGQNKKKSFSQIKREWEADEKRKDAEREQDMTVEALSIIMKWGTPDDRRHKFPRARSIARWILYGKDPDSDIMKIA